MTRNKRHGYIGSGGQLGVITAPDDFDLFFLKGRDVYSNNGDSPSQVFEPAERGGGMDAMRATSLGDLAAQMGVRIHDDQEKALNAFLANGQPSSVTGDWHGACEELWGEDWIAPLSEVLHVNRRTVERWRSGAVAMPKPVLDRILSIGRNASDRRAYGAAIRRFANGERLADLIEDARKAHEAAEQIEADLKAGDKLVGFLAEVYGRGEA